MNELTIKDNAKIDDKKKKITLPYFYILLP